MARTPRSTTELIDRTSDDGKSIRDAVEFWQALRFNRNFIDTYRDSLIAAGISPSRADEVAGVVRLYIEKISIGLADADYVMKELAAEVHDIARTAAGTADSTFRVR